MNEEITKLLTQLAAKLGTTIEQLWSVLIHQAPLDALSSLALDAIMGTAVFILYGRVKGEYNNARKIEMPDKIDWDGKSDNYSEYTKRRDQRESAKERRKACFGRAMVFTMACAGASLFFLLMLGCNLSSILAGFFNPEYWALKQIIK